MSHVRSIELLEPRIVLSFTPAQIAGAYEYDKIYFPSGGAFVKGDGAGQTIAVVIAYRQPNLVADLQAFSQAYGLPAPQITICNQNGSTNPALLPANATGSWGLEASLDVQWIHALAPAAKILVVQANSNSNADLYQAVDVARQAGVGAYAALPYTTVVSMSWGSADLARANPSTLLTTPAGKSGVTFVASTGDAGTAGEYPAAHPEVLAVGGTTLTLNAQGGYGAEVAWSGSNGGFSPNPAPTYQQGIQPFGATNSGKRMSPDVSFDGSPAGNVYVYDSYDYPSSPWIGVYGTSFGAPAWAALVAIADQGRNLAGLAPLAGSQTLAQLYALYGNGNYQYAFHDVTSGSNASYSAGPGYDLVTGLGSPRANVITASLVGYSLTPTPSGPTGTIVTPAPTFTWSAVGGATGYYLTIVDTTTQQTIANNLSVTGVSYTPAAALTNGHSFQWKVQAYDSVGPLAEASSLTSFYIAAPVNHAPAGADKTITTLADTAYTFTAADFGFSDPNDTPANSLLAIKIVTLPLAGTLSNHGSGVTVGQFIALTSINAGQFKFTPASGVNGAPYANFAFQVQDDGGTANSGVDLDPSPNTITVNVTPPPPPVVVISGPTSALRGEVKSFTFTVTDSNAEYQAEAFDYTIDWGDGSPLQLMSGASVAQFTHGFNATGSLHFSVTATNAGGVQSLMASQGVVVDAVQLRVNADNPALTDLVWSGTTGDDEVEFGQVNESTIRIHEQRLNGVVVNQQQDFSGITGRVIAYGNQGNDQLRATGLQTKVTLDGGAGNNTLNGGNGGDILIGGVDGAEGPQKNNVIIAGNGDNIIYGNGPVARKGMTGGNNLIVGGAGADTIYGNFGANQVSSYNPNGDGGEGGQNLIVAGGGADTVYASQIVDGAEGGKGSILIAGSTTLSQSALMSVLSEWTSTHTLQQKLANIQGSGTADRLNGDNYLLLGVTVFNDGAVDQLFSDSNGKENWLLYTFSQDSVARQKPADLLANTI